MGSVLHFVHTSRTSIKQIMKKKMKNFFEFMDSCWTRRTTGTSHKRRSRAIGNAIGREVQPGAAGKRGGPKMNDDRDDEMETSDRGCISHEQRSALTERAPR